MLGFFAYSVSLFATNLIFVDEKILWRCWGEKVNSICVIIFACGSMLLAIMESFKSDVKELCQFYFYILKAGIILLFGTLLFVLINRYRLPDYIFQLWNYLLVFVILTVVLSLIIFIKIFIRCFFQGEILMKKRRIHKMVCAFIICSLFTNNALTTFAASSDSGVNLESRSEEIEEAKEYLSNFYVEDVNEYGKVFSTQYIFKTEEDLEKAAEYIADYGLDKFNEDVESAIEREVAKEPKTPVTRSAYPASVTKTVSGEGNHNVSELVAGLASFDTLGTVEYTVELGYRLTVQNNKFTQLTDISFDIPYISGGGSWGDITIPSYCNDKHAGATANYTVTKSVEISIGNFGFEIKSETDNEVFSLITNLQ